MSGLAFGVNTLCRFCKGTGKKKEAKCQGCGGVGFMAPAPSTPDENSQAAATAIEPMAGGIRARVLRLITEGGRLTESDLERLTGLPGNTIRPRLWELEKAGQIRKADEKGKTPSGRACWRYEVVS